MHGDGYMARTLIEEPFELPANTDGAYRDALRTPSKSPVGSHDVADSQYGIKVIHWLALSHEDNVRKLLYLR